jgi:hypothetical protein
LENKKILECNNINNNTNTNNSNNNGKLEKLVDTGEKKKKSKKPKKESNNNVPNVKTPEGSKNIKNKPKVEKKESNNNVGANMAVNNTSTNVNFLNKNIFAVCGGTKNSSINALKCDSSDDENNVIIQENDNININNINYNNEDGFEEDEI